MDTETDIQNLVSAAEKGKLDVVIKLAERAPDIDLKARNGWTALGKAVVNKHLPIVEWLISAGADVNIPLPYGYTPLMWASMQPEISSLLLQNGADIHAQNDMRETALMIAAANGDLPLASLLLENGAEINAASKFNESAYDLAENEGQYEMLEFLKSKGAVSTFLR